jgi:type I restriction enzyme S subunit
MVTVEHLGVERFSHQNLPLVSDKDKARLSKYILKEGDIVFSRVGSVDRCTYVTKEEDGWMFSGRCIRVRANKNAIGRYLNFYFRQEEFKKMMLNISVGATMPSLNTKLMDNIPLKLPSLYTQQKIAKVLSDLDAKIELNNKINTVLETMAKTLYDYWFVQFDFPDANGKQYKTSGGKMVWNEELKREIPQGWEADVLGSWIGKDKSGDWGKEVIEGNYTEKVHCIRGADLNGLNGNGEVKAPTRYILEKNSHKMLDPHDLIVEISGGSPTQSTGRMAYITKETLSRFDAPIICSNFCKAVTLKDEIYLYNFAFEWNKAYDNGILFGYEGKTSGIKNLLFESFVSSYYTTKPPENLAEKFYDFMEPIQSKKQKNLLENQQLASLRDWLLPMMMNGQVSVGEVAKEYEMKEEVLGMVAEEKIDCSSNNN